MPLQIIIALPSGLQRNDLVTSLARKRAHSSISEVEAWEELKGKLKADPTYFVVIHQSLIVDMSLLPWGNFVILAKEPDIKLYLLAAARGARGYLPDKAPEDLITRAIDLPPGQCLLGPALAPWLTRLLMESYGYYSVLTDREREVRVLKEKRLSNREVAARLGICESTVKKHVEHINHKLQEWQDGAI